MARLVTDYLDETVRLYPDKVAFVDESESITYRGLKERAYRIASALIPNIESRSPIAVCLGQKVSSIVAFLGIAYAGDFYTPIDESMPKDRIKKLLIH